MTALAKNRPTPKGEPNNFLDAVKGGVHIWNGAAVGLDASGYLRPMVAGTVLSARGVAVREVDATDASDGDLTCPVMAGVWAFKNLSGDPVTAANFQKAVYFQDDQTVAATSNSGARNSAGRCLGIDPTSEMVIVATGALFSVDGDLVAANNLSDVSNAATARGNLGANKGAYTFEKISSKAADGEVARFVATRAGTISKFYTVLNAALATAEATVQLKINGSNVGSTTTGLATITQSGSAAGDVDSATPLTTNLTFVAGDVISLTVAGGSTATGTLNAGIEFTY